MSGTVTSSPIVVNVTLSSSSLATEIYPLISSIRPDWTSVNARLVTFTEGLTNQIFGLFKDQAEELVIKLYGVQTDLFIDRESEIRAMTLLSDAGVFEQRVLIRFNNGIIYQYARGCVCSRENVRTDPIRPLIARKLAQFHSVPVVEVGRPYVYSLLHRFLQLLDNQPMDLSSIQSDVNRIEEEILPRLIPNAELVLCHNDLLVKNIVFQ